jgi:glycosyltransferase involved in cell wall biosynthesis
MPEPLVSIILPTFNRAALLAEALASVCAQTVTDWECIVVDDGSTDSTPDLMARSSDRRIRYVARAHAGHPGVVRNAGLAVARGRWIAFLDDDDLWRPEKLAVQMALLDGGRFQWSYTGFVSTGTDGKPFWQTPPDRIRSGSILGPLLELQAAIALPTVVAARALVAEIGGFDETFRIRGDYALWLRLAERAEVVATPELLTTVRDHPGRTFRPEGHLFSVALYRMWQDRVGDPRLRRVCRRRLVETHVGEARRLLAGKQRRSALVTLLRAVHADPREALRRIAGALGRRVRARLRWVTG